MCGRFVAATPPDQIASYFGAEPTTEAWSPNYNTAPTDTVVTVRSDGTARQLDPMRWGLPFWATDLKVGARMINARAETLAAKPAFRRPLERRRCIIPADGFYEWQKLAQVGTKGRPAKQPMYIHRRDGELLALAGLWEVWRDPDQHEEPCLHSCTIITTAANATMSPVHDRMPVILAPAGWGAWLDPANADVEALATLLVPAPEPLLVMHPVSTAVNNVRNTGHELAEPAVRVDAAPSAGDTLF